MSAVSRSLQLLAAVALGTALLAGCAVTDASPRPDPASDGAVDPSAAPTEAPAVFVPDGSADDNLAWFAKTLADVLAADGSAGGRALVDALAAAGFDKGAMQVTQDATSIGLDADSIQVSVRIGEQCLVGQRGGGASGTAVVTPVLAAGGCLVGRTREIDW